MKIEVKKPVSIAMLLLLAISLMVVSVLAYVVRKDVYATGMYTIVYAHVSGNFLNGLYYYIHHDGNAWPKSSSPYQTIMYAILGSPPEGGQGTYAWTVTRSYVWVPEIAKWKYDTYALAEI